MWKYSGPSDPNRCKKEDLTYEKVKLFARQLSKLSKEETFEIELAVAPFIEANPLPEVRANP